jgi:hypothetical protein
MSKSNDGKYLEDATESFFKDRKRIDMACDRLPDTRSARNIIKAQNADFFISTKKTGGFYLECKSVGGKKKILRYFRQYPLMHRWSQAGVPGYVLIHYHEMDEIVLVEVGKLPALKGKQWNVADIGQHFFGKEDKDVWGVLEFLIARGGITRGGIL